MSLKIFYLAEVLNHVLGKLVTYFSILKKSLKTSKQQAWSLWEVVKHPASSHRITFNCGYFFKTFYRW